MMKKTYILERKMCNSTLRRERVSGRMNKEWLSEWKKCARIGYPGDITIVATQPPPTSGNLMIELKTYRSLIKQQKGRRVHWIKEKKKKTGEDNLSTSSTPKRVAGDNIINLI